MVGCIKGLVSFIKKKNENVIVTHCFLHREALMSKTLGENLREVLDEVVKMVNFIKVRPAKSRLFEKICTNMDSQHKRLLFTYRCEVAIKRQSAYSCTRVTTRTSCIFLKQ